jgi:hypothetical protein
MNQPNKPFTVIMPLLGEMPFDAVEQARRGQLISMADQQIRTVQRENEQAYFANGMILGVNRNQYF